MLTLTLKNKVAIIFVFSILLLFPGCAIKPISKINFTNTPSTYSDTTKSDTENTQTAANYQIYYTPYSGE